VNRVLRVLLPVVLLVSLATEIGGTQSYPAPPPPPGRGPFGRHPISQAEGDERQSNQPDSTKPVNTAQLERERYLELKKETTELARMAAELKLAVAESNEHTLSLELAKKADQVEKLSKRIRDRIKHGY
jgi:hypothetical protein